MLGATSRSHSLDEILNTQDDPQNRRLISDLLGGHCDHFHADSTLPGGSNRHVRWTVWRDPLSNGLPSRVLAMAEEIDSTPDFDERLLQAERLEAVGRLAGGVAHDFNNLLTGVLLYCDLLLASIEPLHRSRQYAQEIRKAGLQASGLVRQLLALSRPTNVPATLLSLNEIADGMRNLLARLIGENIEVKFHLDPNLGLVKMDPTQAQQILLNLALNARDAMPAGGEIKVTSSNCEIQVLAKSWIERQSIAAMRAFYCGRQRPWHGYCDAKPFVRTFFYHQSRQGYGTWIGDSPQYRDSQRRTHPR